MHEIVLIPGDGIGPEVTESVVEVIAAAGVDIAWLAAESGAEALSKYGSAMPDATLDLVRKHRVALKGPITTPIGEGFRSANVALRSALDLYSCLRPVKSIPGIETRYDEVDLVIVRENTEDLYAGIEHMIAPGVAESIKVITEAGSTRIARSAFEYARAEKRRRITAVHKANIMKITDGLFLDCVRKVREEYPEIDYDEKIVDAVSMMLVRDPNEFDMILTENLYGDILSDLCAGLVGGLGLVPGANLGDTVAVFEAVHGSAPDIAGLDRANPSALLFSALLMLRHIGERSAADRIDAALMSALRIPATRTRDLGGALGTRDFTKAVIAGL